MQDKVGKILDNLPKEVKRRLIERKLSIPFFIAVTPIPVLEEIGLPVSIARELARKCREVEGLKLFTHDEFLEKWFEVGKITTSSIGLDGILDNGVQTMKIYEFFGPAGVGKTQLCMQLSVNVQLPEEAGGLNGKVIYIDTERGFKVERILQICSHRGIDGRDFLRRVFYAAIFSHDDLLKRLANSKRLIKRDNVRLIVIDNIISPFQISGGTLTSEREKLMLDEVAQTLLELATDFNLAVVLTNKVYSMPDRVIGGKMQPFGGLILDTAVHKKVLLTRQENIFKAQTVDEEAKIAFFKIGLEGISDV